MSETLRALVLPTLPQAPAVPWVLSAEARKDIEAIETNSLRAIAAWNRRAGEPSHEG